MGMGVATLTTSNLAKLSGLSIDKIRRLAFKGALKAIRTTGGHRRFSITQVNKAKKFIRRRKLLSGGNNVISEAHGLNSFMAYVLGLLFADGNVTKKKQVQLELKDSTGLLFLQNMRESYYKSLIW
jgi:excisionase family DNA binding protein